MEQDERRWLVFDGPMDPIWIESFNSVLDDNKNLFLLNGECITLTKNMHMVFELQDHSNSTPATCSRLGMVYFNPLQLPWDILF